MEYEESECWSHVSGSFKREVKKWVRLQKTPNQLLTKTEKKMFELNASLHHMQGNKEEIDLQNRHTKCLLMQEKFFQQRARVNLLVYGDRNPKTIHSTMVVRKRRNTIKSLMIGVD